MSQSYQNPLNIYIKSNKDLILGFIMGLLLLLTIFKQSIGLPILFIFIIAVGGLIKPCKEYLIISGLLIFKIVIIAIITKNNLHDINIENTKILFRKIIIDIIFLFMLFVALRDETKKGFYYFCIALLVADLTFNAYAQLSGVSFYGTPLEIRPGDLIGRSGGVLSHPFYSIDISLVALFCGIFFKSRFVILLVVVNVFISGAQRGLVSLALIAALYLLFYLKTKRIIIYGLSAAFVLGVFLGVAYLASHNPELTAHNERIFRWEYGYEVITSNLSNFNSYIRLQPEIFHPISINLINSPFNQNEPLFLFNAEGYYLTDMVNYGLIPGLVSLFVLFCIYIIKCSELQNTKSIESLALSVFSYFIFLDCFYSYTIGAILVILFYCIYLARSPNPLRAGIRGCY
ncbi:hypothetical protein NHB34_01660 [Polynucleobacter sp. MWH-UH19D]|uniref:hypothetical protein n=1 Tax=Polynucleobacter sp. MWH-UH19D TaxID=1855610 RepID=UPI003364EBFF